MARNGRVGHLTDNMGGHWLTDAISRHLAIVDQNIGLLKVGIARTASRTSGNNPHPIGWNGRVHHCCDGLGAFVVGVEFEMRAQQQGTLRLTA